MISVHELMSTLTGCVIVYTWLEKRVNEVCGFNDPTTASAAWKRAGVITDRVKWGLWKHEDIMVIIEELRQQRLKLNLMLTIITCSTTEASEVQAGLLQLCTGILQSNNAQSVLNWDRQDEQARVDNSAVSTRLSSASSHPSDNRGTSDNTSIMSQRSTFSFRLGRPAYIEDLKASRAYKRLRHFGRGIDSSAESVFSIDSDGTGSWSMLSDITLGDLSVSQIAILNLPIGLADVCNPKPFQEPSLIGTHRRHKPRCKWSSRGRIHNAIENGNGFVVRALLSIGMDIEELDSNNRTPLIHAAVKGQESICKLLLERGAN
ncbi:hypothetical protein BGX38DRAFT_1115206, partial [Terfezia claveryi]